MELKSLHVENSINNEYECPKSKPFCSEASGTSKNSIERFSNGFRVIKDSLSRKKRSKKVQINKTIRYLGGNIITVKYPPI